MYTALEPNTGCLLERGKNFYRITTYDGVFTNTYTKKQFTDALLACLNKDPTNHPLDTLLSEIMYVWCNFKYRAKDLSLPLKMSVEEAIENGCLKI